MELKKIRKKLEKELDSKRFEHTLGVAYTASALAMCHQADPEKALLAGMLHDCAKCMSNDKKIAICEKHHIPIWISKGRILFYFTQKWEAIWPKKSSTSMTGTF